MSTPGAAYERGLQFAWKLFPFPFTLGPTMVHPSLEPEKPTFVSSRRDPKACKAGLSY